MFNDRHDAGKQLGAALKHLAGKDILILGIPRGGVEVACQVAEALSAEFSMLVVRKLPFPDNPESGFGAIAEDGSVYLHPEAASWLSQEDIDSIVREQRREIKRRIRVLRGETPLPGMRGRHVVLVDDGIAMGSTMQAAVICCRNLKAQKITVAAPVASPSARRLTAASADEVVTLLSPHGFRAVADYYENWYDVSDEEVAEILRTVKRPDAS
jgi:putative phosphoribosyl transferase